MPGNLKNTLYPPQIATFMPAFNCNENATIYFSTSPLDSGEEISRVHISVVHQSNNENALIVPEGIMIAKLHRQPEEKDALLSLEVNYNAGKKIYGIALPPNRLKGQTLGSNGLPVPASHFNINEFYKVQIRFDIATTPLPGEKNGPSLEKYLTTSIDYFSEWSTVCLLRPIAPMGVKLRHLEPEEGQKEPVFNQGLFPISGKAFFTPPEDIKEAETETLESFKAQIFDTEDGKVPVLESPKIYTTGNIDPNIINYNLDLQTLDTTTTSHFFLRLLLTTKNQYQLKPVPQWPFEISEFDTEEGFQPILTKEMIETNNQDGIITIHVKNAPGKQVSAGSIIHIKRASNLDNYQSWENLCTYKAINGDITKDIVDNTVQSHVFYKYIIQHENAAGLLSPTFMIGGLVFLNFYDAFLSRGKNQLHIMYDYNISNMKPIVHRVKVDTLGGKYPKFSENALLNYKQFNISGMITSYMDPTQKFLDKKKYLGVDDVESLVSKAYQDYLGTHPKNVRRNDIENYYNEAAGEDNFITVQGDYLWERAFREAVTKWLNDGEPKLYRSQTEGNMVVMINDLSLTPNKTLSRQVWNFSATMYEIENGNSLDILDKLGVYNVPKINQNLDVSDFIPKDDTDYDPNLGLYTVVEKPGQLFKYQPYRKASGIENLNVLDIIKNDILYKYGGILQKIAPEDFILKNIKIYFHNLPHKMELKDGTIYNLDNEIVDGSLSSHTATNLGYHFQFQSQFSSGLKSIFVNERGYYQLPISLNVNALCFPDMWSVSPDQTHFDPITGQYVPDIVQGDVITIEYTVQYKETNATGTAISGASVVKTTIGQESGCFLANEPLGNKIRHKYDYIYKTNKEHFAQHMQFWKGISVEAEPLSLLKIKYQNESDWQELLIGETGQINLLKDYPVDNLKFLGKRMKRFIPYGGTAENQQNISDVADFEKIINKEVHHQVLQDWEFMLDPSVTGIKYEDKTLKWEDCYGNVSQYNVVIGEAKKLDSGGNLLELNLTDHFYLPWRFIYQEEENGLFYPDYQYFSDIHNPIVNTVYRIGKNNDYYIYYRDYHWYPVEFAKQKQEDGSIQNNYSIILAKVPVNAMINYLGNVVRFNYA